MLVFLAYLSQPHLPMPGLASLSRTLHAGSPAAESVIEVLDQKSSVKEGNRPLGLRRARGVVIRAATYGRGGNPTTWHSLCLLPSSLVT
jgi:ABC-type multidrug transport system fused ATPase/permease subunit